ncbi:phosphatase PAP2 family protein [Natronogracilivirga saccharolytica]|uniref:Phosphatase PAP2 family protein n=1 Tax=Natronogracilivirga saccharolytica TaxID=2812953 RepID=A0A8J7S6J7_9BACT|nr:phosphatase PAP2 family protein [Natronogracilivirga saccharolytica]MBP3191198.1 phosphatase PAP2 family protein [Natronogracilivirga saccharolytica]
MPILDKSSRQFPKIKILFKKEILILLGLLMVLLFIRGGIEISDMFIVEQARQFDQWALTIVRSPENPELLRGPHWVDEAVRDMTAMGGPTVLTLTIIFVVGYLLLKQNYRSATLVFIATAGGLLISLLLKDFFLRDRPDIVPALMVETSPSFPSGHSMLSAVVYLTLGSLLTRLETTSRIRIYTISIPIFITILVGFTRVLLGVHYPTDVLFGWTVGFFWASLCWFVMIVLQEQDIVESVPEEGEEGIYHSD